MPSLRNRRSPLPADRRRARRARLRGFGDDGAQPASPRSPRPCRRARRTLVAEFLRAQAHNHDRGQSGARSPIQKHLGESAGGRARRQDGRRRTRPRRWSARPRREADAGIGNRRSGDSRGRRATSKHPGRPPRPRRSRLRGEAARKWSTPQRCLGELHACERPLYLRSGAPAASLVTSPCQTKGQLTTMLVFLSVRSPALRACCSCSNERTRLRFAPAFQVTSTTAHRGG
jgi:hypothetical protein